MNRPTSAVVRHAVAGGDVSLVAAGSHSASSYGRAESSGVSSVDERRLLGNLRSYGGAVKGGGAEQLGRRNVGGVRVVAAGSHSASRYEQVENRNGGVSSEDERQPLGGLWSYAGVRKGVGAGQLNRQSVVGGVRVAAAGSHSTVSYEQVVKSGVVSLGDERRPLGGLCSHSDVENGGGAGWLSCRGSIGTLSGSGVGIGVGLDDGTRWLETQLVATSTDRRSDVGAAVTSVNRCSDVGAVVESSFVSHTLTDRRSDVGTVFTPTDWRSDFGAVSESLVGQQGLIGNSSVVSRQLMNGNSGVVDRQLPTRNSGATDGSTEFPSMSMQLSRRTSVGTAAQQHDGAFCEVSK